jgi:hypothetical protein
MMSEAITFPHDVLTPLSNQRPTVSSLEILQQELSTNAISIPSPRGNGTLGHYALVVPAATYATASGGIAFVPPVSPGAAPAHPNPATAAQITEINRQFLADKVEFATYMAAEAGLKKQLLVAVPATYTNALKDKMLGFANVTTLAIITHLMEAYGTITTDDLDNNIKNLHRDWAPTQPIEDLFEQIRACREFAQGKDPISEATAVRAGLMNIEKTGLFSDAIRDWRKRPDAEKTLINFTKDFRLADAERHRQLTTKTAGYHHQAAATTSNLIPVALAAMVPSSNSAPGQLFYCWTHGAGPNPDHTSSTCKFPQGGHRCEATIVNMLGGNNIIHRKRGETQVYIPTVKQASTKGSNAN